MPPFTSHYPTLHISWAPAQDRVSPFKMAGKVPNKFICIKCTEPIAHHPKTRKSLIYSSLYNYSANWQHGCLIIKVLLLHHHLGVCAYIYYNFTSLILHPHHLLLPQHGLHNPHCFLASLLGFFDGPGTICLRPKTWSDEELALLPSKAAETG